MHIADSINMTTHIVLGHCKHILYPSRRWEISCFFDLKSDPLEAPDDGKVCTGIVIFQCLTICHGCDIYITNMRYLWWEIYVFLMCRCTDQDVFWFVWDFCCCWRSLFGQVDIQCGSQTTRLACLAILKDNDVGQVYSDKVYIKLPSLHQNWFRLVKKWSGFKTNTLFNAIISY